MSQQPRRIIKVATGAKRGGHGRGAPQPSISSNPNAEQDSSVTSSSSYYHIVNTQGAAHNLTEEPFPLSYEERTQGAHFTFNQTFSIPLLPQPQVDADFAGSTGLLANMSDPKPSPSLGDINNSLKAEIEKLRADNKNITSLEERNNFLDAEIKRLEANLVSRDSSIAKLRQENDEVTEYERMRAAEYQKLQTQRERLKSMIQSKDASMHETKQLLEGQIGSLEAQLDRNLTEHHATQLELRKTAGQAQELKQQVQGLTEQKTQLEHEMENLKNGNATLAEKVEKLEVQKAQFESQRKGDFKPVGSDFANRSLEDELDNEERYMPRNPSLPDFSLEDELGDELDDDGALSPENQASKALEMDYSNIESLESLPESNAGPKPKRSKVKTNLSERGSHSAVPSGIQPPLSESRDRQRAQQRPVELPPDNDDQAASGNLPSHENRSVNTTPSEVNESLIITILALILFMLFAFVILLSYWIFRDANTMLNHIPSRYGYTFNGPYNNGRKILGIIPVGYSEGLSPIHSALMAIEKYLEIPNQRMIM